MAQTLALAQMKDLGQTATALITVAAVKSNANFALAAVHFFNLGQIQCKSATVETNVYDVFKTLLPRMRCSRGAKFGLIRPHLV